MGGEGWLYWADYAPDIQAVLDKARQKAFEGGEYHLAPKPEIDWLGRPVDPDNPYDPNIPPDYLAYLRRLKTFGDRPTTITELILWNRSSGDGTRSIIDIEEIGGELYEAGCAPPLPENLLLEWFGTTQPTRQMVEEKLDRIWGLAGRGSAVYVVVYEQHEPRKVLFVGSSID